MPLPTPEAELEHTKMSFGEHLEELRRAVFKSILALAVGIIVGLCIGIPLVDYIQEPLRRGLRDYYIHRAEAKELAWLQSQQAAGVASPADLEAEAKARVKRGGAPHDYFVATDELAASLEARYPELARSLRQTGAEAAPPDAQSKSTPGAAPAVPEGMLRLRLYEPLADDSRLGTIATDSFEPFVVYLKASIAAGLVLASPAIFYFIWEFIAAGLYKTEKKYVHIYLPISLTLFLIGAALAYYFAFDYMLQFLFWFHEKMGIDPYPKLSDWISTVVLMPLGFGASFQLPLVMLLLERIGVFSVDAYVAKWRISVVVIAVLSMVLTPGSDIPSMMIMFIPLTGLYFLGIWMCKHMPGGSMRSPLRDRFKRTKPEDQAGS